MGPMRVQRFRAKIAAGPRGRGVIAVPFDPDQAWGAKAEHPVGGTIDGRHVRGTIAPDGSGWAFTVTPMWLRDTSVAAGDDVIIELAPEGPQRGALADDIAAALEANPPGSTQQRRDHPAFEHAQDSAAQGGLLPHMRQLLGVAHGIQPGDEAVVDAYCYHGVDLAVEAEDQRRVAVDLC